MNYSIKNFVKKNCTETYTLMEMEDLAEKICEDSEGRYTNNSAMKILCRYAYVQDERIEFNVDARNSDQTIDDLKKNLNIGSELLQNCQKPATPKTDTNKSVKQEHVTPNKSILNTKNTKNTNNQGKSKTIVVKKGGFGNLSAARGIVNSNDTDNDDDNNNTTKIVSKQSKLKLQKDTTSNDSEKTLPTKVNAKIQVKSTSVKSIKDSIEPQRNTSLFSSMNTNRTNSTSVIGRTSLSASSKSSSNASSKSSSKASSSSTMSTSSTTSFKSVKSVKSTIAVKSTVPKKGGFGVFKKSIIQNNDKDDNSNKPINKNRKPKNNNGSGYSLPNEKKYLGVKRTNKLYGPYGTDNYHDDDNVDDEISDSIKHRVDIYRMLAAKYYPPQRSPEWFKMRDEMITASDGGTIVKLNPYEHDFGFVQKKVFGKPFETSIDCYHGKKYEQVATMVYEYRMNVKVKEFGLCRHPEYNFLGASPDGIVSEYKLKTRDGRTWEEIEQEANMIEDPEDRREYIAQFGIKTKFVGRMLEIKCPFRRKILMNDDAIEVYGVHGEPITNLKIDSKKGICPSYYWVQVQLQLQSCSLNECDFWQCEIFEYADKEDFLEDTDPEQPWLSLQTGHEKGVLIQLLPIDQINNKTMQYYDRIYNYADWIFQPRVNMTPAEIDIWIIDTLQNIKTTHKGFVFESIKYWKMITSRNITIKRDNKWFADNLEIFRKAWTNVEYFRANKDKADLLKKYINMFPLDCYKKIKEPLKEKGIIMKTLETIAAEPDDTESDKDHKLYARFIAQLDQKIKAANVAEPKDYDVTEDVGFIKEALNFKLPDDIDLDDDQKKEYEKKHIEFVKMIRNHVQNHLFQEKDDIFD